MKFQITLADAAWIIGGGLAGFLALNGVLYVLYTTGAAAGFIRALGGDTNFNLVLGFFAYGVFALAILIRLQGGQGIAARLKLVSLPAAWVTIGVLASFVYFGLSIGFYTVIGQFDLIFKLGGQMLVPALRTPYGLFLVAMLTVPVASVVEEAIFRGVIYQWLRGKYGFWTSACISSVLFTAVHGFIYAGPPVLSLLLIIDLIGISIILAALFERSGSLWSSIAAHAANNFAILVFYLIYA